MNLYQQSGVTSFVPQRYRFLSIGRIEKTPDLRFSYDLECRVNVHIRGKQKKGEQLSLFYKNSANGERQKERGVTPKI